MSYLTLSVQEIVSNFLKHGAIELFMLTTCNSFLNPKVTACSMWIEVIYEQWIQQGIYDQTSMEEVNTN